MSSSFDIPDVFHDFLQPKRFKIAYGGRGSAKSESFCRLLVYKSMIEKHLIACCREFQTSIDDSVYKTIRNIIESMGYEAYFKFTDKSIKCLTSGSEFIFKGLKMNVGGIKSINGITICFIEEAQSVSQESWDVLIPTIRSKQPDGNDSEIWVVFNPDSAEDPTYQMFVMQQRDNAIVKKVNHTENPFFPSVLNDERLFCLKNNPKHYDNIWEGEPKRLSDAVIFAGKFVVESFETHADAEFRFGMDFGYEDPATVVRCYIRDKTLYIDYEAYQSHVMLDDLPSFILSVPNSLNNLIIADSSQPSVIQKISSAGFKIEGAKKGAGSIDEGIFFLQSFEKIVIHERCVNTAKEFRNYSYAIDKRGIVDHNKIVDKFNHAIDAIRYALEHDVRVKKKIGKANIVGF